jgi:glyoxylase-like metal-dependent hydrolase (beta-lactamase superfamily II)
MDEEPDVRYRAGEMLPGGLTAVHTPGPEHAHYAFWRERSPSVLFCPDLIMRDADGELAFIPAEYHDDPEATRESVRRLLDLPFEVLCLDHGPPVTANPHAALRKLLGQDIAQP